MNEQTATLVVGSWSSKCSHCGGNADPVEQLHDMVNMEGEGCGARFVAITSEYSGEAEEVVKQMRPDLPFEAISSR